jgi:hypothetical protein
MSVVVVIFGPVELINWKYLPFIWPFNDHYFDMPNSGNLDIFIFLFILIKLLHANEKGTALSCVFDVDRMVMSL